MTGQLTFDVGEEPSEKDQATIDLMLIEFNEVAGLRVGALHRGDARWNL